VPPGSPTDIDTDDALLAPPGESSPVRVSPRNRAAAPPVYLLALPLVPIGTAVYITSTRYFQFHHHGVDLLAGTIIGIGTAWLSFRWYHAPVLRGAGWAWGPRTRDRAWGTGVGRAGYVGREGWSSASAVRDAELGEHKAGNGNDQVSNTENV
jgi:hypothetical protein